MTMKIQIYTQMGQLVKEITQKGSSEFLSSYPVYWDLCNMGGTRVQPGIYIYRVSASADGQHYVSKSKKLIVLRQ